MKFDNNISTYLINDFSVWYFDQFEDLGEYSPLLECFLSPRRVSFLYQAALSCTLEQAAPFLLIHSIICLLFDGTAYPDSRIRFRGLGYFLPRVLLLSILLLFQEKTCPLF